MKHNNTGIVELIDRALNKGVILNADLIVTVADVPLLAANLKLALASVETMLKYGVMNDWLTAVSLSDKEEKPMNAISIIEQEIIK
ncbi:gas vesicle protein [Candidatus Woesearchaeota archaeon]|nr:gas vesicle protein [Candidatus Woesearchaeota archaeon]